MSGIDTPSEVAPRFESLVGQSGLLIYDPIEDVQAILFTDQTVSPKRGSDTDFVFPIDSAAEVNVSELRTPNLTAVWVRNTEGDLIKGFDKDECQRKFDTGDYLLEISGMGVKLYVRIRESGFSVSASEEAISVVFSREERVTIGARSMHNQPARTLTTSSEPRDLMRAMSLFGNAMKTWSPERTFPTLRGHPPLLEVGSDCKIPDKLTPPDTGISISVPEEHEWLYPIAPLAYWLGATVEPGEPTLVVGGHQYPLGDEAGYEASTRREEFEQHVRDILQFTFFFDSAVRTEGFYDIKLDARQRVEGVGIPLDYESLYDAPLSQRVKTYLDLDSSFEELANRVGRPGWRLTADVQPDPGRATTLPFLARDLAVVRCPSEARLNLDTEGTGESKESVFARSGYQDAGNSAVGGGSVATRTSFAPDTSTKSPAEKRIVGLPAAESMSQAWVGDGFAIGAAKASTNSYLQRLEQHVKDTEGIEIEVIINDEGMVDESTVSDIYGTREHLNYDIDLRRDLSSNELAEVFESDTDFIHYIGHVDPEGFDCNDGYLHADQLGNIGADTFVLNACASYEQGQLLVDKGAIAGVVTLEDVINSLATKVGKTVARLLNYGFPIGSATELIQETIFTGSNYVVVGDSNASLTQSNVPVPTVTRVSLRRDGRFDITLKTYASWNFDVGSMFQPYLDSCDCHYLVPGELDSWDVDDQELDEYLDTSIMPIVGGGRLFWSDETSAQGLRSQLQSYR